MTCCLKAANTVQATTLPPARQLSIDRTIQLRQIFDWVPFSGSVVKVVIRVHRLRKTIMK